MSDLAEGMNEERMLSLIKHNIQEAMSRTADDIAEDMQDCFNYVRVDFELNVLIGEHGDLMPFC